jgi:pyruvate dehydrogenase E2 component (dihydrolipoamide acetyltransferase)
MLQPAAAESTESESTRVRVSPFARKLASRYGVDLERLQGTGPLGAVIAADVERARGAEPPARAEDPGAAMRQAIARAMSRSKAEIPHYYLSHTVDLAAPLAWLRQHNENCTIDDRLLAGVLFVRAVAQAVRKTPEINAHYTRDGLHALADVHVGVAVSLRGGGLVAPAIMHADRLTLSELGRAFRDVVNRARAGQLRSSEMSNPTITITSLGERGVETVYPIIIPPQVAMVGFGIITERPTALAGSVVVRPTVTVTLAADHRVSDGHRGALFLSALANVLKEPPS